MTRIREEESICHQCDIDFNEYRLGGPNILQVYTGLPLHLDICASILMQSP